MSTIKESMTNLRRISGALSPSISTAFQPALYQQAAREGARAILEGCDFLTDNEKESDIPIIVESLTVENGVVKDSLVFKMGGVVFASGTDRPDTDLLNDPLMLRDKIIEWVQAGKDGDPFGKRLDARDQNAAGGWKSNEQIAGRVIGGMRKEPATFFSTDEPGHGALDPTGIVGFIGSSKTDPERLERALLLILNALRQFIIDTLPGSIAWRIRTVIHS